MCTLLATFQNMLPVNTLEPQRRERVPFEGNPETCEFSSSAAASGGGISKFKWCRYFSVSEKGTLTFDDWSCLTLSDCVGTVTVVVPLE
jgi:hypothetical protein